MELPQSNVQFVTILLMLMACILRFKDCSLCGADIEKIEPNADLQGVVDRFIEGHAKIKRSVNLDNGEEAAENNNHVIYEDVSLERGSFLVQQAMRGYSDGSEFDRQCGRELRQDCLLLSPMNYKIPLRWPTGRDVIWISNVKITAQEVLSSGSLTKRMMMLDEEQISFRSASLMFDGVEDYSHQIAEMIGLRNESNFIQAGVRTILDIGCGYGSFGAHLFHSQLLTMCIANYEPSGSQVQLTLERGLPAMVASFTTKQLPYPSLSFDMLHCARCGIDWDQKDGILLIEADRLLKPGGYFVWTSLLTNARNKDSQKRWKLIHDFAENLCWDMLSQQDETVVWKKTSKRKCYSSRKNSSPPPPLCSRGYDVESPYYRELQNCIGGTHSSRWISIEERATWPSRDYPNKNELEIYGLQPDEFAEDAENWKVLFAEDCNPMHTWKLESVQDVDEFDESYRDRRMPNKGCFELLKISLDGHMEVLVKEFIRIRAKIDLKLEFF